MSRVSRPRRLLPRRERLQILHEIVLLLLRQREVDVVLHVGPTVSDGARSAFAVFKRRRAASIAAWGVLLKFRARRVKPRNAISHLVGSHWYQRTPLRKSEGNLWWKLWYPSPLVTKESRPLSRA